MLHSYFGTPKPLRPDLTIAYVGDPYGHRQLLHYANVVSFEVSEVNSLLSACSVDILVVTPLAALNLETDWPSIGGISHLSESPEYSQLFAVFRAHNIPIVGWLHNDHKAARENECLANVVDSVWVPLLGDVEKRSSRARSTFLVPNFPSVPLRNLGLDEHVGRSTGGIAFRDVYRSSQRFDLGRDNRALFEAAGFVYRDGVDIPRVLPGRPNDNMCETEKYQFVGFSPSGGNAQPTEFLNQVLEGSLPIGLLEDGAAPRKTTVIDYIFSTTPIQSVQLSLTDKFPPIQFNDVDYWTHWSDCATRGIITPYLTQAINSLVSIESSPINHTFKIKNDPWRNPDEGQDSHFGNHEIVRFDDENPFSQTKEFSGITENTPSGYWNEPHCLGACEITLDTHSPTSQLMRLAQSIAESSPVPFQGDLPLIHRGSLMWISVSIVPKSNSRKAQVLQ